MSAYDISALAAAIEFDTTNLQLADVCKLSATRFLATWAQSSTVKSVQAFETNLATGAITALSTPYDWESGSVSASAGFSAINRVDDTHFVLFYTGADEDGFARAFEVDPSTGAITPLGSAIEFDTSQAQGIVSVNWDDTHFLVSWQYQSSGGTFAQMFSVNTSTWAVTAEGSKLTVSATSGATGYAASVAKINSTEGIIAYRDTAEDGYARTLTVNTSTWAVTNHGAAFEFKDATTVSQVQVVMLSISGSTATGFVYYNDVGTSRVRPITVNLTTGAISPLGTETTVFASVAFYDVQPVAALDETHFVVCFRGTDDDGFARTYSFTTGTGAITQLSEVEFDTSNATYNSCFVLATGVGVAIAIAVFQGASDDGYARALKIELASGVKTVQGATLATVKNISGTGLAVIKNVQGLT